MYGTETDRLASGAMSERLRGSLIESLTIAASAAAVMIGCVLPWGYFIGGHLVIPGQSRDALHAFTGSAFDGEVAFALAAAAIVVAWVLTFRPSAVLRFSAFVLFVWASWIAVATIDLLSPTPRRMLFFESEVLPGYGFGLIITVIGAIGGSLMSLVWLIRSLRSSTSPIGTPVRAS
jgi:hypothetical protein